MRSCLHKDRWFRRLALLSVLAVIPAAEAQGPANPFRNNFYGAIAYSPKANVHGTAWNCTSDAKAAANASHGCVVKNRQAAGDIKVVSISNGWVALAVGDKGGYGFGRSTRSSGEAAQIAVREAMRHTTNVRLRAVIASEKR